MVAGAAEWGSPGRVDGFDIAALARVFGARLDTPGSGYDPNLDVEPRDEKIDGDDLSFMCVFFGHYVP